MDVDWRRKILSGKSDRPNGDKIRDGSYIYELIRIIDKTGSKIGHKGNSVIAEFRVVAATKIRSDVEPNAPGSVVSRVFKFEGSPEKIEKQGKNLESLVRALANAPSATKEELDPVLNDFASNAQGGRGLMVRNDTARNGEYVNDRWSPAPQTDAEVAARRAAIDAAGL